MKVVQDRQESNVSGVVSVHPPLAVTGIATSPTALDGAAPPAPSPPRRRDESFSFATPIVPVPASAASAGSCHTKT